MQHKQNITGAKPDSLASVQLSYIANQRKHSSCDCLPSLDRVAAEPANHHLRALKQVVIGRNICWWEKNSKDTKCFLKNVLTRSVFLSCWRRKSWMKCEGNCMEAHDEKCYPSNHNIMPHKQLNWYQNLKMSMHAWKLDNLVSVQPSYTADETNIVHQQLFVKPEWQYGSACEEHDFTETRTWFDWSKWTCPKNCEQWCPEADLTTIDASFNDVEGVAWQLHSETGRPKLQNHCHHEHYDKMSHIPKVDC